MGLRPQDWVFFGLIVAAVLFWLRGRNFSRIRGRKLGQGDSRAVRLLEEAGYQVLQARPMVLVRMEIGETSHRFELKNDYLVSRGGHRYLVRLRRDGKPARLQSKMWRNSLLRDVLAFRAAGILVLDVEKESLQRVSFRI